MTRVLEIGPGTGKLTVPLAERGLSVVVATAFHWLDPARRVQKCAEALRPSGALAIVETHRGRS